MFIMSQGFVPGKPSKPSLMFAGKLLPYPQSFDQSRKASQGQTAYYKHL